MKDEIKEILDELESMFEISELEEQITNINKVKDYITNLQGENERLKETNVYCNRTDCIGRIKDSKKYDSVYQEKEDYKSRCEKAIEYNYELQERYCHSALFDDLVASKIYEIAEKQLNILQGVGKDE